MNSVDHTGLFGVTGPRWRRFVCLVSVVILFGARGNAGAANFGFVDRVYPPRLGGMAGSWGALYGDVDGIFINPAGLAFAPHPQTSLSYGEFLADLRGGMIGAVLPSASRGSLGLGIVYFDYGGFQERDRYGALTGRAFGATEMVIAVSYARCVGHDLAFGANLKLLYSNLDQYYMMTVAVDLGVLYRIASIRGVSVGLTVSNLGYNTDPYISTAEELPLRLKFGVTYELGFLPMVLNYSTNSALGGTGGESPRSFSAGGELTLNPMVFRIGYDHRLARDLSGISASWMAGLSYGAGLSLRNVRLDYSMSDYGALGAVHRFGMTFEFGEGNGREER